MYYIFSVDCLADNGRCHVDANCENRVNFGDKHNLGISYWRKLFPPTCTCKQGFEGDGHTCTKIPGDVLLKQKTFCINVCTFKQV